MKTEYSTFTYFVTSLNPAGQTVTSTDIIVSSNVVTETIGVEPTPGLSNQFNTNLVCTTDLYIYLYYIFISQETHFTGTNYTPSILGITHGNPATSLSSRSNKNVFHDFHLLYNLNRQRKYVNQITNSSSLKCHYGDVCC